LDGPRDAKQALRQEILRRREAIGSAARETLSEEIFGRVTALETFHYARIVLAYAHFGSEPRTNTFLQTILDDGKTLVLPRVEDRNLLALYAVTDPQSELVPGPWGIREPRPDACVRVDPHSVDFVLVPGVAFDARGGRLGYGGGFYDLLIGGLRRRPALVAGAFEVQVVERIPSEDHDARVDLVVTERRNYAADP
jgi:5-formyltetrahydrofolate cyclo-ligase